MTRAKKILESNNAFENAEHLVEVQGMSTPRVCNYLNQLVASLAEGERYLEIGTWRGLTLCSAAFGNTDKELIACDKFRFWGRYTGFGYKVRRALYGNLERYAEKSAKVTFYEMDSLAMFRKRLVPDNIAVYFYDGDHTYEGTRKNIEAAEELLSPESTLLVDDFNDPVIRRATEDALENMNVSIDWKTFLPGENGKQDGWWNGLGVYSLRTLSDM